MGALTHPTPWLRDPWLDGCTYSIRFGKRYPFPCFVLVEEDNDGNGSRHEDLRLYPLTAEGRKTAYEDLAATEKNKRRQDLEVERKRIRDGIEKRQCRYCRYFPQQETETNEFGPLLVCKRPPCNGSNAVFTLGGIPLDRIIHDQLKSCADFDLADEFKNVSLKGDGR